MSKSTHYIEILKIKQLIAIWKEIPSRNKPRGKSWIVNEWILREQYNLYSARFWEHYSWSLVLQLWNRFIKAKPLMRKVRTSMRHLLAEKRAIHGTWYTSYFFRDKTVFCQDRKVKFSVSVWFRISWNPTKFQLI